MRFRQAAILAPLILGAQLAIAQRAADRGPLAGLSGAIRDLTTRVSPAVVEIIVTGYDTVDDDRGQTGIEISRHTSSGSGVIVDPAGYIMTNAHVVQGAIRVRVLVPTSQAAGASKDAAKPRARSVDARVVGADRESDLALIRVDGQDLPSLVFGDSDKLQQGDLVFAIGSPMGLRNSVSMGVVSAAERAVSDDNPILYIQTDASINPGNSGGALVDTRGILIGMNTFIMSHSGGNEGIGFAIPSNVVRSVYQQLRQKRRVSRSTVGLFVQDITPILARGLDLPTEHGVMVADLDPGGPGEAAGLKRRDIILSLNSHPIETARQFNNDIYRRAGEETIQLAVQRDAERLVLPVQAQAQPAPWDPLAALASPRKNLVRRLGILCIEVDKEVAALMPDLRHSYGVLVAAKAPEGQFQFIDLQPGDIIHAVNNVPIAILATFQQMIDQFQAGDAVALQIERDGRLQYIAFEIE